MRTYDSVEIRLQRGLERKSNGCLEWIGGTDDKGYGQIRFNGKTSKTHRVAWILVCGPIPPGLCVLHHCDNPPCCDVEKCLFLGTLADNNADKIAKGRDTNKSKTHCPANHPYDAVNTYWWRGNRLCRTCRTVRAKALWGGKST